MELKKGDKKIQGLLVINFRLRCVLTHELFKVIELVGMCPRVPNTMQNTKFYQWMTNDFLKVQVFKRKEQGSQFTCSNLPVVVGYIVHLINIESLEVDIDFTKNFDPATGDMRTKAVMSTKDVRETCKISFGFKTGPTKLRFLQLVLYLIHGCVPFEMGEKNKPVDQHISFFETLDTSIQINFAQLVRPIISGDSMPKKSEAVAEKVVDEVGFLPNDIHNNLCKLADKTIGKAEKEAKVLHFLKSKETRYLNLAANLRLHHTYIESRLSKDGIPDEFAQSWDAEITNTTEDTDESVVLKEFEGFPFLRQTKKIGGPKQEKVPFPKILTEVGLELQKQNLEVFKQVPFEVSKDFKSNWSDLMKKDLNSVPTTKANPTTTSLVPSVTTLPALPQDLASQSATMAPIPRKSAVQVALAPTPSLSGLKRPPSPIVPDVEEEEEVGGVDNNDVSNEEESICVTPSLKKAKNTDERQTMVASKANQQQSKSGVSESIQPSHENYGSGSSSYENLSGIDLSEKLESPTECTQDTPTSLIATTISTLNLPVLPISPLHPAISSPTSLQGTTELVLNHDQPSGMKAKDLSSPPIIAKPITTSKVPESPNLPIQSPSTPPSPHDGTTASVPKHGGQSGSKKKDPPKSMTTPESVSATTTPDSPRAAKKKRMSLFDSITQTNSATKQSAPKKPVPRKSPTRKRTIQVNLDNSAVAKRKSRKKHTKDV